MLAGAAKDVNGIIKITRLVDLHGTCLCQVVDADANRWENLTNEAGVWTGEAGPATPDVTDRVAGRADPSGDNRKFAALDSDDLNVGASTGDPPAGTLIDRSNDWHYTWPRRRDGHRNGAYADVARRSGDHGISLVHFDLPP